MEFSKLNIYSVGVVAKNKPLDTPIIEVTPIEDTPMVDGELTDSQSQYAAQGQDAGGSSYQVSVPTAVTLKATWLPFGSSNRKSAPDVRRGETVVLFRFGDTDQYFWTTLKDDLHLRKLETVIYAFSGTRDESVTEVTAEHYYFLEVSTHNKLIHFHTSKADGEPFGYDIQINTKAGTILIQDDIGNYISFDSKGRQIEMKNADGSLVEVNKKNINLICSDTITQQAPNIIQKSTNHTVTTTNLSETSTNHTVRTATLNEQATSRVMQSSSTQMALGDMQGEAATGDLVIGGISHSHHDHTGVQRGNSTTDGPQ